MTEIEKMDMLLEKANAAVEKANAAVEKANAAVKKAEMDAAVKEAETDDAVKEAETDDAVKEANAAAKKAKEVLENVETAVKNIENAKTDLEKVKSIPALWILDEINGTDDVKKIAGNAVGIRERITNNVAEKIKNQVPMETLIGHMKCLHDEGKKHDVYFPACNDDEELVNYLLRMHYGEKAVNGTFSFTLATEWDYVSRKDQEEYLYSKYGLPIQQRLNMEKAVKMLLDNGWVPYDPVSAETISEHFKTESNDRMPAYNEYLYFNSHMRQLIYNRGRYEKTEQSNEKNETYAKDVAARNEFLEKLG